MDRQIPTEPQAIITAMQQEHYALISRYDRARAALIFVTIAGVLALGTATAITHMLLTEREKNNERVIALYLMSAPQDHAHYSSTMYESGEVVMGHDSREQHTVVCMRFAKRSRMACTDFSNGWSERPSDFAFTRLAGEDPRCASGRCLERLSLIEPLVAWRDFRLEDVVVPFSTEGQWTTAVLVEPTVAIQPDGGQSRD